MWLEDQGQLCRKAVTAYGDPVELAEHEIEELLEAIQLILKTIRADQ
jgi:hypothetical protein